MEMLFKNLKGGFFLNDEKEMNTPSEKSNEELESALDKTENYKDEQLEDELEKLAETFRTELKKAKEQGGVKVSDNEVVDENNNTIPKEELCECCGERKKDTTISANYAYCKECRELMKRYPLSLASVFVALVMVALAVVGVINFTNDFDGYNSVRLAKVADSENKKFSAVEYYDEAIAFFDDKEVVAKKLYKDSAINVFSTLPDGVASFKDVSSRIDEALSDFEAKLPIYKGYKDLSDNALLMYDSFNAFYAILSNTEYSSVTPDDKEMVSAIYNEIGELADKEHTIESLTGEEITANYNNAAVLFSQFMFAYTYDDFDSAYECLNLLWEAYPEYIQMFGYELAIIEVQYGNYKNATKLADAIKANNAEDSSPYVIYAYNKRMQGDLDKAIKNVDTGLSIDETNSDLYRQKGIALMLDGKLDEAIETLETGLSYGEYGVLYYTYLVALTEAEDEEKIKTVNETLKNAGLKAPERVQQYLDGKLTCKQLFMEGTGDIE